MINPSKFNLSANNFTLAALLCKAATTPTFSVKNVLEQQSVKVLFYGIIMVARYIPSLSYMPSCIMGTVTHVYNICILAMLYLLTTL